METGRIKKVIFTICIFFLLPSFSNIYGATLSKPANNLRLLGYWSFNEGTSTVSTDFSGRGNNGTLNTFSAPATASSGWGSGRLGGGLNFDGSSDYVDMGNPSTLLPTSNVLTIAAWVKPGNTGAGNGYIVSKENATADYFMRQQGTGGAVRCSFEGVNAGDSPAATLVNGEWAFIVCVFDGSNNIVYKNGVSVLSGAAVTSTLSDNGDSVNIGRKGDGTAFFTGGIDEVRIYNRALTATEVRRIYDYGLIKMNSSKNNLITNGLIGYWTFNGADMTDTIVTDISSSNNSLDIANGPVMTMGKVGQSLNFDAVDDTVSCTDANCGGTSGGKLDMGTRDWTVSAWIKPKSGATSCNISGRVASKIGDDETQGWFIGIANSYICGSLRNGGVDIFSTLDGTQVTLNEWNHIAIVFDRDGNMTRYLNGVQTGTQDNISSYNGVSIDHPLNFCIGGRDGGAGCIERLFDGSIDEVRIYDRVLTVGEIKQLYLYGESKINTSQNTLGQSTLNTGLVNMVSFNSKDFSDKVYDRSSSANNGYVYNSATGTTKTIGKTGQAIKFDGVNDVVVQNLSSLGTLTRGTVSFWIYRQRNTPYEIVIEDGVSNVSIEGDNPLSLWIANTCQTLFGTVTLNEWVHLAATWDGTTNRTYINGVQSNSNGCAFAPGAMGGFSTGGRYSSGVSSDNFSGKIDELRLYNRALTAAEVKQLYLVGK